MVVISSFDICFIDDLPLSGSDWPNFLVFSAVVKLSKFTFVIQDALIVFFF